jgi:hypothetical protein
MSTRRPDPCALLTAVNTLSEAHHHAQAAQRTAVRCDHEAWIVRMHDQRAQELEQVRLWLFELLTETS